MSRTLSRFFLPGSIPSVLGLGITTTIGYGTLYYSFAILSKEIEQEFLWSKSFIFGIFSLGILIGGLLAPTVGKILDHHGARTIMSIGSLLCASGLLGISMIQNAWHYIFAITFLEIVSTLVLYEAAFVAFSQLAGHKARVPITQITLMAGFASTIFWPLISYLLMHFSWREVYWILASLHLLITLPIHAIILKRTLLIDTTQAGRLETSLDLEGSVRKKSLYLITLTFALIAIPITVMQTHFPTLMGGFGIESATAITLGALIGPSQVGARLAEIAFSKRVSPLLSGIFATSVMFLGIVMLFLSGYDLMFAFAFVLLYGAGQGLSDILRGSIPLFLFGKEGYGHTTGRMNLIVKIVIASVPFGFAYLMEHVGITNAASLLLVVTFSAALLLILLRTNVLKGVL
jgi:MFS family permease